MFILKKKISHIEFYFVNFIIYSSFNVYAEEYLSDKTETNLINNTTYVIEKYHDLTFIGIDGGLYILDKDEKQIVPPVDENIK